ncbi:MAG: hypothetical protein ACK40Z_14875, partial [Dietzia sp.]
MRKSRSAQFLCAPPAHHPQAAARFRLPRNPPTTAMEDDEFGLDSDVLEAVDFIIAGAGQAAGSVRAVSFPP